MSKITLGLSGQWCFLTKRHNDGVYCFECNLVASVRFHLNGSTLSSVKAILSIDMPFR